MRLFYGRAPRSSARNPPATLHHDQIRVNTLQRRGMGRRSNRDRVVGEAVRLVNERGTAAVSTNHIAEAAGISPGNLYYHFRNKEEIIREIWDRIDALWDRSYALPSGVPPSVEDLGAVVEETFSALWEYRFFYRELGALTRRDPELRRRYLIVRRRGLDGT